MLNVNVTVVKIILFPSSEYEIVMGESFLPMKNFGSVSSYEKSKFSCNATEICVTFMMKISWINYCRLVNIASIVIRFIKTVSKLEKRYL